MLQTTTLIAMKRLRRHDPHPAARGGPRACRAVARRPAQAAADRDAPYLKASATVAGEIVRIGDLVRNAGAVADVPIFRAPDLGQTGSVPAAAVVEAVRSHHIIGLDTRGLTEVEVKHAGRLITAKEIEDHILHALAGRNGLTDAGNLGVNFDNPVRGFEVEPTVTNDLVITRLNYDGRNGRFDIAFDLQGSAAVRRLPLRFTGSVSETFDAVVATHDIAQGQLVSASDVAVARRPKAESTPTALTTVEQVQGYSARHAIRAGQALRQADVSKPELVGRNDTVTIVYQVPGITLTVIGKAVDPGGLGDGIGVLNVQSKRTVQATIIGPDRVSVSAGPRLTAQAMR